MFVHYKCYSFMQMSGNIKDADYYCIINGINKFRLINLKPNVNSTKKMEHKTNFFIVYEEG